MEDDVLVTHDVDPAQVSDRCALLLMAALSPKEDQMIFLRQ